MDRIKYFKENQYVHVPNLVDPSVTAFIYNYLIIKACTNIDFSNFGNEETNYIRHCYSDIATETLSGILLSTISEITQKKLCPTYSYTRVYTRGETLKPHRDRPSCEYSITINFGGDPWPIYFGKLNKGEDIENGYTLKNEITMNPGDGIVYMGEELVHWRNKLEADHCAQAFLHYIDTEGPHYPEWAYDKRPNIGYSQGSRKK